MTVDFKARFHSFQDGIDGAGESQEVRRIPLYQNEFVASQAIGSATFRSEVLYTLTDLVQQLVADRMAKRIVDVLEAVQIEHRDAYGFRVAIANLAQVLKQAVSIGEACELIEMSQRGKHPLG